MKNIKLIDFLHLIDSTKVIIWGASDEKPLFEGFSLDIPWYITEYKIGTNKQRSDAPMWLSSDIGGGRPGLVIEVIEED